MMVGSQPMTAGGDDAGARREAVALADLLGADQRSSAAPSTMPEELPAWCTWSIFSTQWYLLQRHGVEAAQRRRCGSNDGLSAPRRLDGGAGRG